MLRADKPRGFGQAPVFVGWAAFGALAGFGAHSEEPSAKPGWRVGSSGRPATFRAFVKVFFFFSQLGLGRLWRFLVVSPLR